MANRTLAAVSIGLLTLGGFSPSKAAIVEQIINLPGVDNVLDGTGPANITVPTSFNTIFNLFDPNLGTLTGMTITFDYRFELTMEIPASGGGGGGSAGGDIYLNGDMPFPAAFGAGNGTGGGGAPSSTVVIPWAVTGVYAQPNDVAADPYDLTTFTATTPGQKGSFDFRPSVVATPAPDVHATIDLMPTSTVKVQYEYTPVPEPAAASLLLLGGLAGLRRRRA